MPLAVHAENDVLPHDGPHDQVDDVPRGERLAVAQHAGDVVVAVEEEDGRGVLVGHQRRIEALHRRVPPGLGELGVGVAHIAGHRVVEEAELLLCLPCSTVAVDGHARLRFLRRCHSPASR